MISNNEYQILSAIWSAGHSLTAREILHQIEDRGFKERTVHSIITVMLEKDILFVEGQRRSGRTYSRCFNTDLKFEDFHSDQIKHDAIYVRNKNAILPGIFSSLIDDKDISPETLSVLEKMLSDRRKDDDAGDNGL